MSNEKKTRVVIITITQSCNLECRYCFEKNKTKQTMNIDTAKGIILNEANNIDNNFTDIQFDLFGGEPLLNSKLIIELIEWAKTHSFKKSIFFHIGTNGTLLNDELKKWLLNNKRIVNIGLSLDGTPETHNYNRCNSYNMIDIDFFIKNYPTHSVRATIYPDTIGNLSNDIIHLHTLGFKDIEATFAHGVIWDIYEIRPILERELMILCNFYLEHKELKECSIFKVYLYDILNEEMKNRKWCGMGDRLVAYDFDGLKYPCHTFQPNTNSLINMEEFINIDYAAMSIQEDPYCNKCLIEPICPNCYGSNLANRGNLFIRDKELCEIVKIKVQANAYLRAKQIEEGTDDFSAIDRLYTIRAIKAIHNFNNKQTATNNN